MSYNGWKNYETWVAKLWMDNDEGSYHFYRAMAETFGDDVYGLSESIKDDF